jgi:hypothetical protein
MLLLSSIAILALPALGSAQRLDPRQQEDDSKINGTIPVAKSYIVEYAPVRFPVL